MKTISLIAACAIVLTACGGGGSSSGGQPKEVTELCIQKTVLTGGGNFRQVEYKNICDFSVTLALYVSFLSSFSDVVTLAPMQVFSDTELTLSGGFFACRTPSTPRRSGRIGEGFENECS